jgi:hypothetical protein
MYQATTTQRDWVYWLIKTDEGKKWVGNYIFGQTAFGRMEKVLSVGTYDDTTKAMLNFLLEEFKKENTPIQKQYYDYGKSK